MTIVIKRILPVLFLILPLGQVAYGDAEPDHRLLDLSLMGEVIEEQGGTVGADLKSIFKAPFEDKKRTLKWGLIIGGLVLIDRPLTEYYQRHVEPALNWELDSISPVLGGADGYIVYGVAGHYLGSVIADNEKGQHVSIMATKAAAYSLLVSHVVLKPIFGRNRPPDDLSACPTAPAPYTCDPYDFGNHFLPSIAPVQYGSAMPSFHMTMYFSVARVYQLAYDNYWLPYGLALAAYTSNIRGHQHWVSDMVAGSAIGIMIGSKIYKNSYPQRLRSNKVSKLILPVVTHNTIGLHAYYRF